MDLSHLKSMTNALILSSILFNFPWLDGNVPRTIFHGVYISQLIRFARVSNHLADFWFNWWVSSAPEFQCCYFCESSCLFNLSVNFDFSVSKIMHL